MVPLERAQNKGTHSRVTSLSLSLVSLYVTVLLNADWSGGLLTCYRFYSNRSFLGDHTVACGEH